MIQESFLHILVSNDVRCLYDVLYSRGISLTKISYTFGKNPFVLKKNPSKIRVNPFVLKKSRTLFPMSEVPLVVLREDSQIDFGTPNVNRTYGGGGGCRFQPMTFRKRLTIS